MTTKPAYEGEARLIRWADSGGAGRTVTLQIDESSVEHPFKHLPWGSENGQRMAIVCVLVNDDEEPIGPDQAKANAKRPKARTKSKAVPETPAEPAPASEKPKLRSNLAAILCKENAEFRLWLSCERPVEWDAAYDLFGNDTAAVANHTLKSVLGIKSKTDLDHEGPGALAFDRLTTDFAYRNMVRA
jgi:hypothetical protein